MIGLYTWFRGGGGRVQTAFLLFSGLGGLCLLAAPALSRGHPWAILGVQSGALGAMIAMIIFVRLFPTIAPLRWRGRRLEPEWLWLAGLGLAAVQLWVVPAIASWLPLFSWSHGWSALILFALLLATFHRWIGLRRAGNRRGTRQYALIAGGALVAFLPMLAIVLVRWLIPGHALSPVIAVPLTAIWPATIAYAMLRYQVAGVGRIYRRGVLLLIVMLVASLSLTVLNEAVRTADGGDEELIDFLMAIASFLTAPLALWALGHLDRLLFGGSYSERHVLADTTRALASTLDGPTLMHQVLGTVTETLQPRLVAVMRRQADGHYAPAAWQYQGLRADTGRPPVPLPADHPALVAPEPTWCLAPEQEDLDDLSAWALVARAASPDQVGPPWLLGLARRVNDVPYSRDDRALLETLIGSLALALANAHQHARIQASEARFRSLVQSSSDLICVVTPATIVRTVTPSIRHLLGYDPEELVGRPLAALAHPADQQRLCEAITAATAQPGTHPPVVWRVCGRDGTWRHVETIISNLLAEPAVAGLVLNTRDISDHQELQAKLAYQAFHDPLTGLANRALFRERVEQALRQAACHAGAVTILFLDVDDFKTINDSFGHEVGDQLLMTIAIRMRQVLRASDVIARLGGDEFAVLLDTRAGTDGVLPIAQRLLETVRRPVTLGSRELTIRASVGIATCQAGDDVEALLRNADMAMYSAKSQGKDGYASFRSEMHAAVLARLDLETALRRAIERGELDLYHQPVVDLTTNQISGLEALLRWQHPTRGLVTPATFVPLAEETGLIVPIGHWVITETARRWQHWQALLQRDYPLTIGVNLSARQFFDPDLLMVVAEALAAHAMPAHYLVMEITESLLLHDTERVLATFTALKAIGVRLALDDFGTGYSSLKYLQQFPIDIIKIDKVFIDPLAAPQSQPGIAHVIIELGRVLDRITVAEGIEGAVQAERLRALGCQYGQGYHFGRPGDLASTTTLLRASMTRAAWPAA